MQRSNGPTKCPVAQSNASSSPTTRRAHRHAGDDILFFGIRTAATKHRLPVAALFLARETKQQWIQEQKMLTALQIGSLRELDFGGHQIPQHVDTNYVNATALCKTRNKLFGNWRRLDGSQSIIERVSERTGKPEQELIVSVYDQQSNRSATWVDYRVAASLATWVDPMFVVYTVDALLAGSSNPSDRPLPLIDWEKKMDVAGKWANLMQIGGGMDERDRLFFKDTMRVIGRHALAIGAQESRAGAVVETHALQPELSISEVFQRNGVNHPSRKLLIDAGRRAAKRYRDEHDGEDPPRRRQHVDGVERDVNHYYASDLPWLTEIIQTLNPNES